MDADNSNGTIPGRSTLPQGSLSDAALHVTAH